MSVGNPSFPSPGQQPKPPVNAVEKEIGKETQPLSPEEIQIATIKRILTRRMYAIDRDVAHEASERLDGFERLWKSKGIDVDSIIKREQEEKKAVFAILPPNVLTKEQRRRNPGGWAEAIRDVHGSEEERAGIRNKNKLLDQAEEEFSDKFRKLPPEEKKRIVLRQLELIGPAQFYSYGGLPAYQKFMSSFSEEGKEALLRYLVQVKEEDIDPIVFENAVRGLEWRLVLQRQIIEAGMKIPERYIGSEDEHEYKEELRRMEAGEIFKQQQKEQTKP